MTTSDTSPLPICVVCGSEMQYNGDGSDKVHCTVCTTAEVKP